MMMWQVEEMDEDVKTWYQNAHSSNNYVKTNLQECLQGHST